MTRCLLGLYQLLIPVLPFALAAMPVLLATQRHFRLLAIVLFPILYPALFLLICGLLSRPFKSAIRAGRFKRSLDDPVYGPRRLHALCWTTIYYSPFYSYYLGNPWTRTLLFRLFGYGGQMDFTIYPDTWIRDLSLNTFGPGAYLANRAAVGSNLALQDGWILVRGITVGAGGMIGHLAMVAAGTTIGDGGHVSHGCACGIRTTIGRGASVGPGSIVDHMATIGDRTVVGTSSYVGLGARLGPDLVIPAGANIPGRADVLTQADIDRYLSSETKDLMALRGELSRLLA